MTVKKLPTRSAQSAIRSGLADYVLSPEHVRDVSERNRLEREILEIAMLVQKRLGADLHDECGQELTALGLLTGSLVESLKEHSPAGVEIARKIGEGIKRVIKYVRDVAHGLQVEIDPDQFSSALQELTSRLNETSGIRCLFEGDADATVKDRLTATHLYHIAQEACTNAIKHSAAGEVHVELQSRGDNVILRIWDDGVGIPDNAREGLGLRIMRNRAGVIAATLTIERGKRGGTVVTCTLQGLLAVPRKKPEKQRSRVRVLIVDDHPAVREALSIRISHTSDLEVCGEATGVGDALRLIGEKKPDVAIVDIALEAGDGIDLIKRIRKRDEHIRVLVWSMYGEILYAERALRAGANGYITKEHATDQIVEAIRQVLAGKVYLSPAMSERILQRSVHRGGNKLSQGTIDALSDRELEVFRLIGRGVKTADIAVQLNLSVRTVWTYRDRIRDKLDLRDGAELVHYATQWVLEIE